MSFDAQWYEVFGYGHGSSVGYVILEVQIALELNIKLRSYCRCRYAPRVSKYRVRTYLTLWTRNFLCIFEVLSTCRTPKLETVGYLCARGPRCFHFSGGIINYTYPSWSLLDLVVWSEQQNRQLRYTLWQNPHFLMRGATDLRYSGQENSINSIFVPALAYVTCVRWIREPSMGDDSSKTGLFEWTFMNSKLVFLNIVQRSLQFPCFWSTTTTRT